MLNGVTMKTSNKATEALTLPDCNKCCPDCGRQFVQLRCSFNIDMNDHFSGQPLYSQTCIKRTFV